LKILEHFLNSFCRWL